MTDAPAPVRAVRFCQRCGAPVARRPVDGQTLPACRRCGWVWYFNPAPGVLGLVIRRGRVLLVRRRIAPHRGYWTVPGGFIAGYETMTETLRRELREEIGAEAEPVRFLGAVRHVYGRSGPPSLKCFFEVRLRGDLQAGSDAQAVAWFPLRRLPARLVPTDRTALRLLRRGRVPFFE
ncbi:MAG: NUDIX domain-containing protein [Candidatus Rokubacteria bacterium]|nr:NUDIX domain-containing protein [Candidatus Rokubacteria bacterium]